MIGFVSYSLSLCAEDQAHHRVYTQAYAIVSPSRRSVCMLDVY